jgi:hypothetical protein
MFSFIFAETSFGTVRLMWFSEVVPGTVTQVQRDPDGGRTWDLSLACRFEGADYTHTVRTGVRQGETFKAGDMVHV